MQRKIAIILAGGVSLGSFEAGVMTELLYALDFLNRSAADDEPTFELDVMTGGSAGSMTAALVAHSMLSRFSQRRRDLFHAWVDDIDIETLLDPQGAPSNALFSRRAVRQIVERYLPMDSLGDDRASFAPQSLALSFSLSNMNGIDYAVSYASGGDRFTTTLFTDMARFTLDQGNLGDVELWRQISETAIASGAFPIAFRPLGLLRGPGDYPGAVGVDEPDFFDLPMSFVDGGTFNNEPVREAILRAAGTDQGLPSTDRLFLLVDPTINTSRRLPRVDPDDNLLRHGARLMAMVRGESIAQDWLRAHRRNQEIGWRDELVEIVAPLLATAELPDEAAAAAQLEKMVEDLGPARQDAGQRPFDLRQSLEQPVIAKARDQLSEAGGSELRRTMFENLVLVVNSIAGLVDKADIDLHLIGANAGALAGDELAGFGGFLDRSWREHDFRIGRQLAHQRLQTILRPYPRETDAQGEPLPDYRIEHDLSQALLSETDRQGRLRLRQVAVKRAHRALKDLGMGSLGAWLASRFLSNYLGKKLALGG